MRVCIACDRLYPYTVGGADRWYRNLAEALAERGEDVTFVTQRQWPRRVKAEVPGVRVITIGPRVDLYSETRRRILPGIAFALGLFRHLLWAGRRYDVVHVASFPFLHVLAAILLRPIGRYRLVIDWHEVWTRDNWDTYLGPVRGFIGWFAQRACLRSKHRAICFSLLHARRLGAEGFQGELEVVTGEYAGVRTNGNGAARPPRPVIVYAGRQIPEKRIELLVEAFDNLREELPGLRCQIFGDGPARKAIRELVERKGLSDAIDVPGFVEEHVLEDALAHALCMVLPSVREGYGLVVVEASALGTPSVVVDGPDNAAVELIEEGENGIVAPVPSADAVADAVRRVHDAGMELRASTAAWFSRNERRLSLHASLDVILQCYGASSSNGSGRREEPQEERAMEAVDLGGRAS
jgi:glycosyltransferase involved in cell wall biosynthesis